jgi:hypothetical protein
MLGNKWFYISIQLAFVWRCLVSQSGVLKKQLLAIARAGFK